VLEKSADATRHLAVTDGAINMQYLVNTARSHAIKFTKRSYLLDDQLITELSSRRFFQKTGLFWKSLYQLRSLVSQVYTTKFRAIHGWLLPFIVMTLACSVVYGGLMYGVYENPVDWQLQTGLYTTVFTVCLMVIWHYYTSKTIPWKPARFLRVFQSCARQKLDGFLFQRGVELDYQLDPTCNPFEPGTIDVFGCIIEDSPLVVPRQCSCNLAAACAIRAGFARNWDPNECAAFSRHFRKFCKQYLDALNPKQYSLDDWMENRYNQSRKDELHEGYDKRLTRKEFNSGMFVKAEAYVGKKPTNFKPRKIETRTAALLSRVGPYFWSLTKEVKLRLNIQSQNFYASGNTALELGDWLESCSGSYLVEIDYSNWDGSMTPSIVTGKL
jgi:hypothetical protein